MAAPELSPGYPSKLEQLIRSVGFGEEYFL
jgi:hypothetical protein